MIYTKFLPPSKKDRELISTLDLFEKEFVLFIGAHGDAWSKVASELIITLGFPLIIYKVADDGDLIDPNNIWYNIYDITVSGAILIRPDGHIAWRCNSIVKDPKTELQQCFDYLKTGLD